MRGIKSTLLNTSHDKHEQLNFFRFVCVPFNVTLPHWETLYTVLCRIKTKLVDYNLIKNQPSPLLLLSSSPDWVGYFM